MRDSDNSTTTSLDQSAQRAAYFSSRPAAVEGACQAHARADKSDPFAYARAKAHYRTGVCQNLEDYSVEFHKEPREYLMDGRRVTFDALVPKNWKRP